MYRCSTPHVLHKYQPEACCSAADSVEFVEWVAEVLGFADNVTAISQPILSETVCPICRGTSRLAAAGASWNGMPLPFTICEDCGLKYMNPRPSEAWYEAYYNSTFWYEHTDAQDVAKIERKHRKEQRRARMLWAMLSPRVSLAPGDRVLDVGTGWGFLPNTLKDKTGCTAAAIEPSDWTAEFFTKELGIERLARSIYDPSLRQNNAGQFKLVTFSTALENTYDPMRTLRIIHDLLRADGMVFIHTPNVYFEDTVNIFHPQLFGPESLQRLLAQAGFEVVWIRHSPRPGDGSVDLPSQAGGISGEGCDSPINPLRIDVLARKGVARNLVFEISATDIIARQREGLALMERHRRRARMRSRLLNRFVAPVWRVLGRH